MPLTKVNRLLNGKIGRIQLNPVTLLNSRHSSKHIFRLIHSAQLLPKMVGQSAPWHVVTNTTEGRSLPKRTTYG